MNTLVKYRSAIKILRVPTDLEDVSKYPNLFAELLRRGWSEKDLEKLAGRNMLRVMRRVEQVYRLVICYYHHATYRLLFNFIFINLLRRLKWKYHPWSPLRNGYLQKTSDLSTSNVSPSTVDFSTLDASLLIYQQDLRI